MSFNLGEKIKINLTNSRTYPYNPTNDNLSFKVDVLKDRNVSYLQGLPIEIYLNDTGDWVKCIDTTTNRYGSCLVQYPTNFSVYTLLAMAKVTYKGYDYWSNKVRVNIIYEPGG